MSNYLGFDTSNYTTSVALFDSESNKIIQKKQLLPVKSGEKGLRQSDAVFHHTVQLPELVKELFSENNGDFPCIGPTASGACPQLKLKLKQHYFKLNCRVLRDCRSSPCFMADTAVFTINSQ